MAIGGFNGTDPAPTLAQFQRYVAEGSIHYYMAGGGGFGGGGGGDSTSSDASAIASWVIRPLHRPHGRRRDRLRPDGTPVVTGRRQPGPDGARPQRAGRVMVNSGGPCLDGLSRSVSSNPKRR